MFKRISALVAVVAVALGAQAQNLENSLSTLNGEAASVYFTTNPNDTIVASREVKFNNNAIEYRAVVQRKAYLTGDKVEFSTIVSGENITPEMKTIISRMNLPFEEVNIRKGAPAPAPVEAVAENYISSLSNEQLNNIISNTDEYYEPAQADAAGGKLNYFTVGLYGGGKLVSGGNLTPMGGVLAEVELNRWVLGLYGELASKKYTSSADAEGWYLEYSLGAYFGYKVLQSASRDWYIAPILGAGYQSQKTDTEGARIHSKNNAFDWKAEVRLYKSLSKHLGIFVQGGVGNSAEVENYVLDSEQTLSKVTGRAEVGVSASF
ncbi:MAG: hypothetical protein NC218_00120 [Acetobacter sp.]|nr:hypothetical protein [Acetobacter sp.]